MARVFTSAQLTLLQSGNFKARLLTTWFLDQGTFLLCDDVEDLTDGTNTWIGASMLAACSDIRSSSGAGAGFAAESVTVTLDGVRMGEVGFSDPDSIFQQILTYNLHNKRCNFTLGISALNSPLITLEIPLYAGKINNAKLVDTKSSTPIETGTLVAPVPSNLVITIDSLAMRYQRITARLRSHADQLEIDASDMFFQYTMSSIANSTLYWGKINPVTGSNGMTTNYGGSGYSIWNPDPRSFPW